MDKYVSLEMFEKWHQQLMDYIGIHDDLMLDGETICPKCGEIMTTDKCENCKSPKKEESEDE
jgi:recombinational DNA repair protein RecR